MFKKIVFVGGHHTPAISVIEETKLQAKDYGLSLEFSWIGHKYSMWGDKSVSAEYQDVTSLGIPFYTLKAGKFYRTFNPLKLIRIPWGFIGAFYYLLKIRPNLIVSFGGYMAVPVVFVGWLLGIPSVTHEQTTVSGLASRFISLFCKTIYISFENSQKYFPHSKTEFVGNPIRKYIFVDKGLFKFSRNKKTVYITGGKQGSHVINSVVASVMPKLLGDFNIIHQCGSSTVYNDSDKLKQARASLPLYLKENYLLEEYFDSSNIGSVFSRANFIVSRSGANTVYEIGVLGIPAILIPIPWSSHGEQRSNAAFLESGGACKIVEEKDLSEETLLKALRDLALNYETYKTQAESFSSKFNINADKAIAKSILNLLTK